MLLTLSVISEHAAQLGLEGYKVFDERGGDIGRLETSHWMLRDPEHLVSARHARIFFERRGFYLEDTSTNGIFVNDPDRPAPRDAALPLQDGDRLFIGSFEILVQIIEELPVMVAEARSARVELPELSIQDRTATLDYGAAGPGNLPSAPGVPPAHERDVRLELIALTAVAGAMDALRSRDEALRNFGIPVSGPHAPAIDPLLDWPRDLDEAVQKLLEPDSAHPLSIEALAEAYREICIHQTAILDATRAACDGLFSRLNLDRNTDRHLRALFANEFARMYAERIYALRVTAEGS